MLIRTALSHFKQTRLWISLRFANLCKNPFVFVTKIGIIYLILLDLENLVTVYFINLIKFHHYFLCNIFVINTVYTVGCALCFRVFDSLFYSSGFTWNLFPSVCVCCSALVVVYCRGLNGVLDFKLRTIYIQEEEGRRTSIRYRNCSRSE